MAEVATTKLLENDKVIVWEMVLEPGESTGVHTHEHDYIIQVIDGGKLQATDADGGNPFDLDFKADDTYWVEVKDGEVCLSDIVTMYAPSGDSMPAYRYVKTIVKLQNCIHNVNIVFNTSEWAGAPLVPDREPTTNRTAKRPKDAVSALYAICDALGDAAIIGDRVAAKESITAAINGANPDRLDCTVTFPVSGNFKIGDFDMSFGFVFGGAAAA